jgi:hypothetical protein
MSVGRNDPCPCGSGNKFKKCHGAVINIARSPRKASGTRECGTCTACCDGWVKGTILGHDMFPGTPCHFRGEQCCTIYERRPEQPCRAFVCGWLEPNSPFPDHFRPNETGVMIVRMQWRDRAAYVLTNAGRDPDEAMLRWMRDFSRATGSPFFYEENGERTGFGPREFQLEMLENLRRDEKLW